MILWNFQQKESLERCIAVVILGILISFAIEIYPKYLSIARVTELNYAAHDYEVNLIVDRAMTGKWSEDRSENMERAKPFKIIKDVVANDGNFLYVIDANHEHMKDKTLDGQTLGFTVYTLNSSEGYSFYSWHCGRSTAPAPYSSGERAKTSLSAFYTHSICAE